MPIDDRGRHDMTTGSTGVVEIQSNHSVNETVARLKAILSEKGITLFATIDHSGEAEKVGLTMRPTKLLIFGSPQAGTPLMIASPGVAIDLPLKILVREDAEKTVWISYNSEEYLATRHHLGKELVAAIAGVSAAGGKSSGMTGTDRGVRQFKGGSMTQSGDENAARRDRVDASLARHGGLSYLEIPAADIAQSARFYAEVVGWNVDGDAGKFGDSRGLLIGRLVKGRPASREAGMLPYVYVDRIEDAVASATECGGELVKAVYPEGNLWVAVVRDPAGNLVGLWQEAAG